MAKPTVRRRLEVALLGSRGIPACYGGYETFIEELGARLVERGVGVTVYSRSHYTSRSLRVHRGVDLVVLPTVRTKHLDTPIHTLLSCCHAVFRRYDAALMVNGANALFVPLLRLARIPTALHVDGIEHRRAKWGPFGRLVYAFSERLARFVPDRLITDAEVIRQHYLERHHTDSTMIAYGVTPTPPVREEWLDRLALAKRGYFLYVSRFEPENNPHQVIAAYRDVPGDLPLVMVGGAPYAESFVARLRGTADRRVLFPGAIYGDGYRELMSHARAYVHATEVGGTHPALVEAMGYGNCVLVNDTAENREVAGDCALYFTASRTSTLAVLMARLVSAPDTAVALRERASQRARQRFSWDAVTASYLALFEDLAAGR